MNEEQTRLLSAIVDAINSLSHRQRIQINTDTLFYHGYLSNVNTVLYTAPPQTTAEMREITMVNTDSAARTVRIYIVPPAPAVPTNADLKYMDFQLAPGESWEQHLTTVVPPLWRVYGYADAASMVAVHVSGTEQNK